MNSELIREQQIYLEANQEATLTECSSIRGCFKTSFFYSIKPFQFLQILAKRKVTVDGSLAAASL